MVIATLVQIAASSLHFSRTAAGLISILTLASFSALSQGLPASLESFAHGGFSENPMSAELDRLHPQPAIITTLNSLNPINYSIFTEAIRGVDLENRAGTLTLFAPNDEAFKAIPKKTLDCMQTHVGKMLLRSMISFHSVFGNYPQKSLSENTELESYAGFMLPVHANSTGTFVGAQQPHSKVIQPNHILASGGVLHGIDSILAEPLLYLEREANEVCGSHKYSSSINAELL